MKWVLPMVTVSILPCAEFGRNDNREGASYFIISTDAYFLSVLIDVTTSTPFNESWLTLFESNAANSSSELQNLTSYEEFEKNPQAIFNKPIFQLTSSAKQQIAIYFLPLLIFIWLKNIKNTNSELAKAFYYPSESQKVIYIHTGRYII